MRKDPFGTAMNCMPIEFEITECVAAAVSFSVSVSLFVPQPATERQNTVKKTFMDRMANLLRHTGNKATGMEGNGNCV